LRIGSYLTRKGFAKTVFPLIEQSTWTVDIEPVRVGYKKQPAPGRSGDYPTLLITRIHSIELDLGISEIVYEWQESTPRNEDLPARKTLRLEELPRLKDTLLISGLALPNRRMRPVDLAADMASMISKPITLTRNTKQAGPAASCSSMNVMSNDEIGLGSTADAHGRKGKSAPVSFANEHRPTVGSKTTELDESSPFERLEEVLRLVADRTSRTYKQLNPSHSFGWRLPTKTIGGAWSRPNGRGRRAFVGELREAGDVIYVFDAARHVDGDGRCILVLRAPGRGLGLAVIDEILASWAAADGRWGNVEDQPLSQYARIKLKHPADESNTALYSERIARAIEGLIRDGG
jgi:hypothetical protein